jgi:hypothetical protein
MRACGFEALETYLRKHPGYDACRKRFKAYLVEILTDQDFSEDEANTLARQCALNKPEAEDKVKKILNRTGRNLDVLWQDARLDEAAELVQKCAQHDQDAVAQVGQLLEAAGTSMDAVMADALAKNKNIEAIERFDRFTALAEDRRNASLREIDRHRLVLGELLRRTVQQIEGGNLVRIEAPPSKGKSAA